MLPSTLFPFRAVGVRPPVVLKRASPPLGGGDLFQMRPRAALPSVIISPPVRRRELGSRVCKGVASCSGDVVAAGGRQKPSVRRSPLSRSAPGSPPPRASEKPARRGSARRRRGSIRRVHAAPGWFWGEARHTGGVKDGPTCRGSEWRWQQSPRATLAESSDRRVSGPSVERARLRGRGGSGRLCAAACRW